MGSERLETKPAEGASLRRYWRRTEHGASSQSPRRWELGNRRLEGTLRVGGLSGCCGAGDENPEQMEQSRQAPSSCSDGAEPLGTAEAL